MHREMRNKCRGSVGKPEEKRPPGSHRRRWEDNIKKFLTQIMWSIMEWINLAPDRDQWRAYEHGNET
jgi:hypothetical protein